MAASHETSIRVYYEDTDWSGRVYHANYLRFMERGRTEFLRAHGIVQSTLERDGGGIVFVVGRIAIEFVRPAAMDDLLEVATQVALARGPIVRLQQEVCREGEVLVRAEVTVVALREGKMVRLPPEIAKAFADRSS